MAPKKKAEEVYVVFSHNPMSQLVLAKIGRVPSSHDDPVEFDLFTARVSYFISRNFSLASRQTRYNPLYHHRRRDKRSYIIFSFQPFTTSIMILAWIVWTRIWFFYFFFPSENVNDVRRFMRQPHVARLLLFLLLLFLFSFFSFCLLLVVCVRCFQGSSKTPPGIPVGRRTETRCCVRTRAAIIVTIITAAVGDAAGSSTTSESRRDITRHKNRCTYRWTRVS